MLAVNYTNFRDNMKSYLDKVTDDYETIIIPRKDNKNVVVLSEEEEPHPVTEPATIAPVNNSASAFLFFITYSSCYLFMFQP